MIPFNKPLVHGAEFAYIRQAVSRGQLAGNGHFTARCHTFLRNHFGSPSVLLTHSCTAALEMTALLLDLQPGDEVIMPSYTFVSTANAFALRGATPVFVDIRPDTLNIDERLIEAAITPRTRAIVAVHYAGVSCEMDAIVAVARRHNLFLVEDAAQAFLSTYRGRPTGSIGDLAAISFHETKNITSGEGGALVINNPAFADRADVLWHKGTNRSRYSRGEVDRYTWIDLGSSYLAGELMAAFLSAQLEHADTVTSARMTLWQAYDAACAPLEPSGVTRPTIPDGCRHNAHMYYVLLPRAVPRAAVLHALHEQEIHAIFHYVPLHSSPGGRRFGRVAGSMAVTDDVSERLIRLPLWVGMDRQVPAMIVNELSSALAALV
jgi:dTDP-4-amino-4,6-dideoxygalactose transaminase